MTFARVQEAAGLTKVELAAIYGVSRQTIHAWGSAPPRAGSYTARMAAVITRVMCRALDQGILPLGAMDKTVRAARVAKMAATSQNLKPAPAK